MINSYTKQTALVRRAQRQIRSAVSPISLERTNPHDKNPLKNYPNLRRRTAPSHMCTTPDKFSRISNTTVGRESRDERPETNLFPAIWVTAGQPLVFLGTNCCTFFATPRLGRSDLPADTRLNRVLHSVSFRSLFVCRLRLGDVLPTTYLSHFQSCRGLTWSTAVLW